VYSKIKIASGVLTTVTDEKIVVGYGTKQSNNSLTQDTSTVKYLKCSSATANYLTPSGDSLTSAYFASTSTTKSEWTNTQVTQCAAIVGPKPMTSVEPTVTA
jgi:hypothetical protein